MKRILAVLALATGYAALGQDSSATQGQSSPVSFSGYVEGYYGYDLNKPSDNNRPSFLYSHNRHNEFNVNLAFLKGSYNSDWVRANLALAIGTYMNANYAAEPGVLKNVFEANAGIKLSRAKTLWLDIGIIPSHIGFESAVSKDNWTLTRSLMAENSPYFESGAKLSYASDDGKLQVAALALNGWQRITRVSGNSLMSWGTQVYVKPTDKISLNYSTFLGTDKPDAARLWRIFHNFYGVFQFTERVGLTAGFDIGSEQATKGSNDRNTWYATAGILRFTPASGWAFALRGEYFSDGDGVIIATGTPGGSSIAGLSANADFMPVPNAMFRLELRNLAAKDDIFTDAGGDPSRSAMAFTVSVAVGF